jgi:FkbM family methyltransferase
MLKTPARADTARIGKLNVRYVARWSFDYQHAEIFENEQYRFSAERDDPFIVDAGANIGLATIYFKTLYPGAEVLAFEPNPEAFVCLQENARLFGGVRVENAALAEREGLVPFYFDSNDPGSLRMSTVPGRARSDASRDVRGVRLSRYLDREVDFLKLDVEGAEFDVLHDLCETGAIRQVKQMLVEYHHHLGDGGDRLGRFLVLLEQSGFGYQLEARLDRPLPKRRGQDVRVFGYRD